MQAHVANIVAITNRKPVIGCIDVVHFLPQYGKFFILRLHFRQGHLLDVVPLQNAPQFFPQPQKLRVFPVLIAAKLTDGLPPLTCEGIGQFQFAFADFAEGKTDILRG